MSKNSLPSKKAWPPIYLDLFDDGLLVNNAYFRADDDRNANLTKSLLDAARFQILLAILFGRQIVIPESWAVSSPIFHRIFNEINSSFPSQVNKRDHAGVVSEATMFPFSFCLFSNQSKHSSKAYLLALANRLSNDKRVKFLDQIVYTGEDYGTLDIGARSKISKVIIDFVNSTGTDEISSLKLKPFEESITDAICSTAPANTDLSIAASIAANYVSIVKQLMNPIVNKSTNYWNSSGQIIQTEMVGQSVSEIFNSLKSAVSLKDTHPNEYQEFCEFFQEASTNKFANSDVMGMWKLLNNRSDNMKLIIEAFGRYCLNRGYGRSTGAVQSTVSFKYYCKGNEFQFAYDLLGEMATREHNNEEKTSAFNSLIKYADKYDLDDTIDWSSAWKSGAIIAKDYRWHKKMEIIEDRMFKKHADRHKIDNDDLQELFDLINGEFQDLSFEVIQDKKEAPSVAILKKEIDELGGPRKVKCGVIFIDALILFSLGKVLTPINKMISLLPTERTLGVVRKIRKNHKIITIDKNSTKLISG